MTTLFAWLGDLFGFLGVWAQESFRVAKNYVTGFWGFGTAVVAIMWVVAQHIIPMLHLAIDTLNGIVTGSWDFTPPTGLTTVLMIANTFAPLDEFMSYLTAYGVLVTSLAIYRMVKAWFPTDGNS